MEGVNIVNWVDVLPGKHSENNLMKYKRKRNEKKI